MAFRAGTVQDVVFNLQFGPAGTTFSPPAEIRFTWLDLDDNDKVDGFHNLPEGRLRVNLSAASLLSAGPSPGGGELGGAAGSRRVVPVLGWDGRAKNRTVSNEI